MYVEQGEESEEKKERRENVPTTDPLSRPLEQSMEKAWVLRCWIADLPNPSRRPLRETLQVARLRYEGSSKQHKNEPPGVASRSRPPLTLTSWPWKSR